MNSLLDPTFFFVSDREWQDSASRDVFLAGMLDHLRLIDEYALPRISWSDELEACIWTAPQLPPWRVDRDYRIPLVPVIMRLFAQNRERFEVPDEIAPAAIHPELTDVEARRDIRRAFLRLVHVLVDDCRQVVFVLGSKNRTHDAVRFRCPCGRQAQPPLIRQPSEWAVVVDIKSLVPRTVEDFDHFRAAVEATGRFVFGRDPGSALYQVEWTDAFAESVVSHRDSVTSILFAVTKRLFLTQTEASRDHGLRDEPVQGADHIRRFRTSRECRVHYMYPTVRTIRLLVYYGPGEHDDGL